MKVVIIHRATRVDRKPNVDRLCALFPQAIVLPAFEPVWETDLTKRAVRGCSLSHLIAVRDHLNFEPLLVLEDDAVFCGDKLDWLDVPSNAAVVLIGSEVGVYGDETKAGYREVIPPFFGTHAVLYMPVIKQTNILLNAALTAAANQFGSVKGELTYESLLCWPILKTNLQIYRPNVMGFTTLEDLSDTFQKVTPARKHALVATDTEPLLSLDHWDEVFSPWANKNASLLAVGGNQGDLLINAATRQLFKHHNIREVPIEQADVVFYPGGGSIAGRYKFRDQLCSFKNTSLPKVSLPQSWETADDYAASADILWVRDHTSLKLNPRAKFAPDLALAYRSPLKTIHTKDKGLFFRFDKERTEVPKDNLCDPCEMVQHTHYAYLALASLYKEIHTNRLHFAIAALITGCPNVTLYPNDYHKNFSVWESSLKQLNCKWSKSYNNL